MSFFTAQGVLLLMTVYFGYHQLKQLGGFRTELFDPSTWHIVDLAPLLLVTASILMTVIPFTQGRTDLQRYLNAFALFSLWINLLFHFRIRRSFSYLVNLLASISVSIQTFIILLMLAIVSFAGSFFMLAQAAPTNFAPTYPAALRMAFELSVGNYDTT